MTILPFRHADTVAARLRSGFDLLTALNDKTPKGEKLGYVQAILYLAPHDLAGGKTVCPHSTPACRAGCLFHAGRGRAPRQINARMRRTQHFLRDPDDFFDQLVGELVTMRRYIQGCGMKMALRLNGTSDIRWERYELEPGKTIFELFEDVRFFDYTRFPPKHRDVPENWSLTYSLADDPIEVALEHLRMGRNVAVVTASKFPGIRQIDVPGIGKVRLIDGDEHDLRFLDPHPALVLLKPKGTLLRGGPMVRQNLVADLMHAAGRSVAEARPRRFSKD